MKSESKKFAEVLPIIKLPRNLGVFEYRVPEDLIKQVSVGTIVRIPFRKRNICGMVWKLKDHTNISQKMLKNICGVEKHFPTAPHQPHLVDWMSQYYLQSPALVVKTLLSRRSARLPPALLSETPLVLPRNVSAKVEFDLKSILQNSETLYIGNTFEALYLSLARHMVHERKQMVILFAERALGEYYWRLFSEHFPKSILGQNIFYEPKRTSRHLWDQIYRNKIKIVLGTRSALFFPYTRLGFIVIDNEDDPHHKQWDQNPRYHARETGKALARLTGAKILMTSSSPSFFTFYSLHQKRGSILHRLSRQKKNVICKDIQIDRMGGNREPLESEIFQKLSSLSSQAMVVTPKKGDASLMICRDCSYTFQCKICDSVLTVFSNANPPFLFCGRCQSRFPFPNICPRCRGIRFHLAVGGTSGIEKFLRLRLPQYSLGRFEAGMRESQLRQTLRDFLEKKIHILVSTQGLFSYLPPNLRVEYVVLLFPEIILAHPDFTAPEQAWRFILQSFRYGETVMIQSRSPQHRIIQFAVNLQYESYFQYMLEQRKKFSLPPYGRIIKLIFQEKTASAAQRKAQDFVQNYKSTMRQLSFPVEVFGPLLPYHIRVSGKYRYTVIIKTPESRISPAQLLPSPPSDALIDVDPISLW